MNQWFNEHLKTGFLEFSKDDLESYELDYIIRKNSNKFNITEMFSKLDVENEINSIYELRLLKEELKGKKHKKCIVVFQKYDGKTIDICFIIKRNNDSDNYSINSLQIKCSDSFIIDDDLLRTNRYEMTYLKNKFEYLFNIKICESYFTYLNLMEKPKKCALDNSSKFFYYYIKEDALVNFSKQKLEAFPFYEACKIEFINIDSILKMIRQLINFKFPNFKFQLKETNKEKIIIKEKQIKNSLIIIKKNDLINIDYNINGENYNLTGVNDNKYENSDYFF